jgi:hypothetical protein
MKKQFMKSAIATAVMGVALVATGSAVAGIANTKHNLGSSGTGNNHLSATETGEICIFCHTPHGGDNSAKVPLWNKKLVSSTHFTTYDQLGTSTLDAAITNIGSVSLACLTCHDGTQAIDNIINGPGSGDFVADGGGTPGRTWAWDPSGDGSLGTDGQLIGSPDTGGTVIFTIGTDLTNDHPVSVQYAGGGYSSSSPSGGKFGTTTTRDMDFNPAVQIGTGDRWYVQNTTMAGHSGSDGAAFDKWDFKLYTRTVSGTNPNNGAAFANEPEPFVECGSCHDPHMETTTFLRIDPAVNGGASNNGSKVCLTCHTK